jgi:hypothetical protein
MNLSAEMISNTLIFLQRVAEAGLIRTVPEVFAFGEVYSTFQQIQRIQQDIVKQAKAQPAAPGVPFAGLPVAEQPKIPAAFHAPDGPDAPF